MKCETVGSGSNIGVSIDKHILLCSSETCNRGDMGLESLQGRRWWCK